MRIGSLSRGNSRRETWRQSEGLLGQEACLKAEGNAPQKRAGRKGNTKGDGSEEGRVCAQGRRMEERDKTNRVVTTGI